MSAPDPQLNSIRRAFDAASDRLYRAKTMQEAEDELSNVLHQLYRLGELCRWRLSQPPGTKLSDKEFHKILTSSDELRMARAAMWARKFNTHDVLMVATTYDPFGRWMPFLYGTAFAPLTKPDDYGRDADYDKFLAKIWWSARPASPSTPWRHLCRKTVPAPSASPGGGTEPVAPLLKRTEVAGYSNPA